MIKTKGWQNPHRAELMEQHIQPVGQEVSSEEELDTVGQGHREISVQIHLHTHVFKRNQGLGHLCMSLLLCA